MQHFIIDGFNLFHKIGAIADSTTPRRDLVNYIRSNRLTGSSANRVTIVFDGYETAELHTDPEYRIVFSDDRTADDIIKEYVRGARNKRELVVVSDDLEIRSCAGCEGAFVCRPVEFIARGERRQKQSNTEDDRGLRPSQMMDITEELTKKWVKDR